LANFQRWPRISENQKKDGKGRLQVGCFSLLVAHGRGSRAGHKPEWAGLACWPAHPRGGERVEEPALGLQAVGAADSPRREEAQDLKRSRPACLLAQTARKRERTSTGPLGRCCSCCSWPKREERVLVLGIGPTGLGAFPQAAQQGRVWDWGCSRRACPR